MQRERKLPRHADHVTSAKVIATCEGQPVAAMKMFGSGRVFTISEPTWAPASRPATIADRTAARHHLAGSAPGGYWWRLAGRLVRSGDGPALLVVVNDTVEERTSRIALPAALYPSYGSSCAKGGAGRTRAPWI